MSTVTIRIPEQLREDMERLSRQEGRALSDLIRESMRRYIISEELRQIRRELRPYAEAQGFLSDEDVFKAVS